MPRDKLLILVIGLAGSLLVNVSGQAIGTGIADVQGGIGASADEGSWLTTVYTMAQFAGIVCATPLTAALGLRRYTAISGLVFALAALACAFSGELAPMIVLRALQGFAGGGFGPLAFTATFVAMGGPRLPFGLSLLALVLVLPVTFGPAFSGLVVGIFGWQGLFLVQAAIGAGLAAAVIGFVPTAAPNWEALRRDWAGLFLLAAALGASLLIMGQGTRLYWLDSPWIVWTLAIGAGAWAGFLYTLWRSPMPALDQQLIARRSFIAPLILNLLFRSGFAGIVYLVPQFLIITQGYRPEQLGWLYLWAGIPQLLAFPIAWWLLQRVDGRRVATAGLLLFGYGAFMAAGGTNLVAAPQFHLALALAGVGQVMVIVPVLIAGAGPLKPADGPTASLLFNATTVGGNALGVALMTELVTERQRFHLGALAESAAAHGKKLDLIDQLASVIGGRVSDDAIAGARAFATVAMALRREASVLTFNDGFLLVGALLIASVTGLLLFDRMAPFRKPQPIPAGVSS